MLRSSASHLLRRCSVGAGAGVGVISRRPHPIRASAHLLSTGGASDPAPASAKENSGSSSDGSVSFAEAKRLMRLVNVEALKRKLGREEEEVIGYSDLLEAAESMGVARSREEAAAFARVLDEAGVILLFRDKVYLHPDKMATPMALMLELLSFVKDCSLWLSYGKTFFLRQSWVVDLVRRAVPLALAPENDPRREELKQLQKRKEEIDMLAHKQVRCILWSGLGFFVLQVGLFFRLTFWEFSWDVMEPIAFFTTTTGIVVGYAYFLFTSRDPTYQDFMKRLYLSRQRKLSQRQNFNMERLKELQKHCKHPLEMGDIELDTVPTLHKG